MGCASSKQSRCRHCQSPYTPVPRSYSMHVHHPPQREGDSYHLVALTSTSLGSLQLELSDQDHQTDNTIDENSKSYDSKSKEFSIGVIEAKTWSSMISQKIPKIIPRTPIRTPLGEPETINTWELMEGLEDSPLRLPNLGRCFSFHLVPGSNSVDYSKPKLQENGSVSPKAVWLHMTDNDLNSNSNSNSNTIISDFDPEVIATFRKSLEELSPTNPFYLRLENEKPTSPEELSPTTSLHLLSPENEKTASHDNYKMFSKLTVDAKKVVIYFTSLRGVRKTYEDCCHARMILKGLGIRVDERDVSMHNGFREELKELLGDGFNGGGLPRVFVNGRYIGGAEEIRQMHEDGVLEKVIEGCEVVDEGGGGGGGDGFCEACGDVRFVPCEICSGSCKIYYDGDDEGEWGFQRCPDCNENGLIRCPVCCY
ncbi:hypothetical protein HHK36_015309 [Tetracentron sinense]|uniref:Glutaredoxin domain-containing protein n=1 Tax=Tetracentron sinense TaxID=13715 RepID=A0A834Z0K8_TETSI|nr:hypothetical protein HHK36_015309 [Tetracentron sinense]